MPSFTIKCCMVGCEATDVHQHRFPNPATHLDRFNTWLEILRSEDLRAMDPAKVYTNRRICSAHFLPKYQSPGNPRLHRNAVPTLDRAESIILLASPSCTAEFSGQVAGTSARRETTPERTPDCHGDLLRSACVTRHTSLTPKAKMFYKTAVHWKRAAFQSRRRHVTFKTRLAHAEKFAASNDIEKMSVMTPSAQLFFKLQMRETQKSKKLRRFTLDEKTMSLSLLKQSARSYDLLEKMFALPSRRTLNAFLGKITLRTGINKRLFAVLRTNVLKMIPLHRTCSLMFDEISLTPQLQYNERLDQIDGFVDDGLCRSQDFADHALVFMVRGVVKNWKQAVAFTLCESSTKSGLLQKLIKEVIVELRAIGLNVVSTVCDQASANCSAINQLIAETRAEHIRKGDNYEQKCNQFEVNEIPVIALYDVPHLFKGLRNHFARKNIVCVLDGNNMTGDWQHIADSYVIDQQEELGSLRFCPNLTERHITLPQSSDKMKVKYCTQVLSQRVAMMLNHLAKKNDICAEARQTALIVLFLDQLFDSLNSCSKNGTGGKPLTSALSEQSDHWEFWRSACKVLRTMEFLNKVDGKKSSPPSIRNLTITIRGMHEIFRATKKKGAEYLCMRNFNQDPLENFFGMVRSQGARNISPSCSAFTAAFKTLTIYNFMAKHSVGANCEEDVTEGALSTLRELLTNSSASDEEAVEETYEDPELVNVADDNVELSNYCSGKGRNMR
ncbi:hypothetical protein CBL_02860 [Carabus blaptoides fortunei]